MAKFRVGDEVVALPNEVYSHTNNGWRGKVVSIRNDGDLIVQEAMENVGVGTEFTVNGKYFKLLTPRKISYLNHPIVWSVITLACAPLFYFFGMYAKEIMITVGSLILILGVLFIVGFLVEEFNSI